METLKHDDADRQRFRALVLANVRFRFVLSREDFERRVLNLARQRAPAGVLPSLFAGRLSLDDYYLATACAGGDEEAWAELIAAHRGFVHRFARRILREPEASDLAAELIADLWQHRKIERYEGRSSLRTWLGTVVAHAAVNAGKAARTRARHAHRATAFQTFCCHTDVDHHERSTALAGLLVHGIARQPVRDQLLVLLYYEQALTLDQIASMMSVSKAALK